MIRIRHHSLEKHPKSIRYFPNIVFYDSITVSARNGVCRAKFVLKLLPSMLPDGRVWYGSRLKVVEG